MNKLDKLFDRQKELQDEQKQTELKRQKQVEELMSELADTVADVRANTKNVTRLTEQFEQVIDHLKTSDKSAEVLKQLEDLDDKKVLSEIKQAIKDLKLEVKQGDVNVNVPADVFKIFKATDSDINKTSEYHSFTKSDGSWFIMRLKKDGNTRTYRFTSGKKSYKSSWKRKEALDYVMFYEAKIDAV